MASALEYPHIVKPPDGTARLARLPRIRVAMIVDDYLGRGWSAEEILLHYPHLEPAEVHAALAYYHDHQAEIDREREIEFREAAQAVRSQSSRLVERLRALKNGQA